MKHNRIQPQLFTAEDLPLFNQEEDSTVNTERVRESRFRLFGKDKVDATNVADFLARYYKPDRYTGRGQEYASSLLNSYQKEFDELGITWISHHDSVTGQVVSYCG